MQLPIYNTEGNDTGETVELNKDVFGLDPNVHVMHMDVKLILANGRQGTHKVKEKGEVDGSTKKLFKQKGTGGARRGQIRSPLMRKGGIVFGPRPGRDYGFKLNKKVKRLARLSALSAKAQSESIQVLENFTFEAPKTKDFLRLLTALNSTDKKILFVTNELDKNIYLSGRNLPKLNITPTSQLNTYDILNAEKVIFLKDALLTVNQLS
jgi:large subunit ribosomal protein L4